LNIPRGPFDQKLSKRGHSRFAPPDIHIRKGFHNIVSARCAAAYVFFVLECLNKLKKIEAKLFVRGTGECFDGVGSNLHGGTLKTLIKYKSNV
jgi:hypothetical protein